MTENVEPNAFDDVPLTQLKGSAFFVPEEADVKVEDDDASLPLVQRLAAMKPVTRKQAYFDLSALLEASGADDPSFAEYGPQLKKLLTDNASLCHEGALSVAFTFASKAPDAAVAAIAASAADAVVEKHLSGKLQAKAVDVILALIEAGAAVHVQSALVKGAAHKVPKTCAAAVKALTAVLRSFGPVLDTRALLGLPVMLLEHRDKAVRDEATVFVGELRRLRGDDVLKEIKGLSSEKINALKEIPLVELDQLGARHVRGRSVSSAIVPSLSGTNIQKASGVAEAFDLLSKLPRTKGSDSADKWVKSLSEHKWQVTSFLSFA